MEHNLITIAFPIANDQDGLRQRSIEVALRPFGNLQRHAVLPSEAAYTDLVALRETGTLLTEEQRAGLLHWRLMATELIHFMSLNVVARSKKAPAHVLLEISGDGPPSTVLKTLAAILGEEIPALWDSLQVPRQADALASLFERRMLDVGPEWGRTLGLTFSGTPGMTVLRILAEAKLARSIFKDLLSEPMNQPASPLETLEMVRRRLWDDGEKWAFFPEPIAWQNFKSSKSWKPALAALLALAWPLLLGAIVVAVLVHFAIGPEGRLWSGYGSWTLATLLFSLLPLAGLLYVLLRRAEAREDPPVAMVDKAKIENIMKQENHCVPNHLFGISTLKPGHLRRLTLRFAFLLIGRMAKYKDGPGALGKIKTIHFARWVLIPRSDQLVFLSNYGGSWESYLEDFIEKAHEGLTAVWSNAQGFPKARRLFWDGATDGDRFKRWARKQQEPTRLWFCAYPNLTTRRIQLNALIRQGIASAATETEAADWLSCFGSAPRPAATLKHRILNRTHIRRL